MLQLNRQNNLNRYYYDSLHDTLTVYLDKSKDMYSEEIYKGIYIIYDEYSDNIIGAEILDFKYRNIEQLKNRLPIEVMNVVNNFEYS